MYGQRLIIKKGGFSFVSPSRIFFLFLKFPPEWYFIFYFFLWAFWRFFIFSIWTSISGCHWNRHLPISQNISYIIFFYNSLSSSILIGLCGFLTYTFPFSSLSKTIGLRSNSSLINFFTSIP